MEGDELPLAAPAIHEAAHKPIDQEYADNDALVFANHGVARRQVLHIAHGIFQRAKRLSRQTMSAPVEKKSLGNYRSNAVDAREWASHQ